MTFRPANTLVFTVIMLVAIGILVTTAFSVVTHSNRVASVRTTTQKTVQTAEAGVEKAVFCLNNPTQCGLTAGQTFSGETTTVGSGSYTTTVSVAGNEATITSTATVDGPQGSVTKEIVAKTTIAASVTPAFSFGVQAGIGGISMSNNAFIDGNIYTSGSVTGSNGAYVTGDAILTPSPGVLDSISNPAISPLNPQDFGRDGSQNDYLVQSFIPTVTERVYSVDLKLAKVNAPTSTVKIRIYSDSSNNPGSDLTGGGQDLQGTVPNSTDANWFGTSNGDGTGWKTQIFNPPTNPILTAGTKYWLVLSTSGASTSRYWTVVTDADDTSYGSGTAKRGGSTSGMTALNKDLAFRTTMGGVNPTLSLPSVQGTAYAYTIDSTTVGVKAYYNNVVGTVRAGGQTCNNSSNSGNCYSGQSNQPTVSFPITDSDISAFEGQAELGGTQSSSCAINGGTIGPKRFDCDVSLSGTVTMNGTVWINGNLTISNGAVLKLSDGYGTSSGVIIADYVTDRSSKGKILLDNNGNLTGNATAGTYIMAISTYNNLSTGYAIDVSNNLSAGVLYSPFGKTYIKNNASLKEVTAYQLILENNASVEYETGLASAVFTSGPGGSWTYKKGSYQIVE